MSETDIGRRNGKLDLSHLTPEEVARKVLETPPPPEREVAKLAAQERRKKKREQAEKEAS